MSNTSELHVIFGTGPVGLAVADELVARGKRVRVVNRRGRADVATTVEVCTGDATDTTSTIALSEGASVVYNCTNPPYTKWPEIFPHLQAGVLEGAAMAGAKLVAMENVYMYGETHGKPMTENMAYNAHTRKGKVRAKMSQDLMAAHERGKVRVAIGRASDFYGPRTLVSGMGERVFYPALAGKGAQILGDPDRLHTYTYMADIGKALAILGERDEALGQAWHIPSAETLTTRQFVAKIYEQLETEPKVSVLPKFLLNLLSPFIGDLREVKEMLYEFEEDFVLDHSAFEAAFGNHATPLNEAIRCTIEWYQNHPK
jgi:nucleoside-diphosphate-sugar epimerase